MAIAQMAKVIIVSYRTEASELLEALQRDGICQVLNAQEAMVSRDSPELAATAQRPKDIEELLNRLGKCIAFLKNYAEARKGLASVLSPRVVIDEKSYNEVVSDEQILKIVDQCQQLEASIEKTKAECESLHGTLQQLQPWQSLQTPVEQIGQLQQTICLAGLLPIGQFEQVEEQIGELAGAIQQIGTTANRSACLVVCIKENINEVQKLLRSAEFEPVSFGSWTGTIAELIKQHREKLSEVETQLQNYIETAAVLAKNLLKLQILHDHYENLLNREQAKDTAPATQSTVLLEGWVKERDYKRLEETVSRFGASSLTRVEPAEDEEIPVEIENKNYIRPFEVITRLYGMPRHFEVDPTVFLAPFFALFFALCLTDAGYGLVMVALMILFVRKIQGDRKLMWMLAICSAVTIVAGALTGGWFGNAHEYLPAWFGKRRGELMWFDPLEEPMIFFKIALGLGYLQIMTGLVIAFVHNLKQKRYVAAVCDQLTWLIMLNSIVALLASKFGVISGQAGKLFGYIALIPAAIILLFSHREGGWLGRIGMGTYNLFSAIFYMGDVLSYLRLMALGMVTAGLAMAINVIAKIAGQIPYGFGFVAMILVLVGGHTFNMAINALGAFVHTLRLQYVEFFPKFLIGGGRSFEPLSKEYKHIYIVKRQK
ncbi:MAG: V-type ATP synthase subunit I [Sedimentisphaerales bacterium]